MVTLEAIVRNITIPQLMLVWELKISRFRMGMLKTTHLNNEDDM